VSILILLEAKQYARKNIMNQVNHKVTRVMLSDSATLHEFYNFVVDNFLI